MEGPDNWPLQDRLGGLLRAPMPLLKRGVERHFTRTPGNVGVRDVGFHGQPGNESLIGRNGAGKTALLKILLRVTEPSAGWAEICGFVGTLLEVNAGFIRSSADARTSI